MYTHTYTDISYQTIYIYTHTHTRSLSLSLSLSHTHTHTATDTHTWYERITTNVAYCTPLWTNLAQGADKCSARRSTARIRRYLSDHATKRDHIEFSTDALLLCMRALDQ